MSRVRSIVSQLHPRLTVAWLDTDARSVLSAELASQGLRVDRALLDDHAADAAQRRREMERVTDAALEEKLRVLDARRAAADLALEDLVTEQCRLRDAAEWCVLQPARAAVATEEIASSAAALAAHSKTAREATRRLERVLEQRAASEAALEEARRELGGLGATGVEESDVRRQMEAASQDLRAATTEYQEAMKEVARRRAALDEAETAAAMSERPVDVPRISDGDQLQAMRRALRAKFDPATTPTDIVDAGDVERVRADLREAEARADAAAEFLSGVRRTIDGFESELIARSVDGDARDVRHDAAIALEAQVSSVERQLSEAEEAVRSEADDATRAMSRAELSLDRLRQESRDRQSKLRELVALVPAAQRPPMDDDLVVHVETIASTLRSLVEPMQPDIDDARAAARDLRIEHDDKAAEHERRRAGRDDILSEDRAAALRALLDDAPTLVVLDDVVTTDGRGLGVADIDALEPDCPVVVLTEDRGVAGWAIELPADRGRLVNAAGLWTSTTPETAPSAQNANAHHPEPSSSR